MISSVIIRPEAEEDIKEAFQWYDKKHIELGKDFLHCVEEGIKKIRNNPQLYPIVYRNIRRILIRRFPFCIFFIETPDKLVILAVIHGRRNPKRWKERE